MYSHLSKEQKFKYFFIKGFKIFFMVIFFFLMAGFVTMWLWNALIPSIFGLTIISFWQAIGLLALSKILFSGFGGQGGKRHRYNRQCGNGWSQMSPEEKEQMRDKFKNRFGSGRPSFESERDEERNAND